MRYELVPAMLLSLGLAACNASAKAPDDEERASAVHTAARAELVDRSGMAVGSAELHRDGEVIRMSVDVEGLTPGRHAMHIHETGDCADPEFSGAGGHFNPTDEGHGLSDAHADGHHVGDLVNIVADGEGRSRATRVIEGATLVTGAAKGSGSLLREGGTAVVIHAEPDDGRTNPAGRAGTRVACGIIVPAPPVP